MLTLYFAFATFGLFSAVVADVAHSVRTVAAVPELNRLVLAKAARA